MQVDADRIFQTHGAFRKFFWNSNREQLWNLQSFSDVTHSISLPCVTCAVYNVVGNERLDLPVICFDNIESGPFLFSEAAVSDGEMASRRFGL